MNSRRGENDGLAEKSQIQRHRTSLSSARTTSATISIKMTIKGGFFRNSFMTEGFLALCGL